MCGNKTLRTSWSWGNKDITYDKVVTKAGSSSLDENTGKWKAGFSGMYQVSWSAQNSVNRGQTNLIFLYR